MMQLMRIVLLFYIYAFFGWCMEVAFAACKEGRFVNRGFLNGPICPIYGFGVVGVALLLQPLVDNLPLLFVGSVVVTTAIEYLTGFVLEKVFHARWWDYSDMPLNIGGYVCLLFSLLWGLACVVVLKLVHPLINGVVNWLPDPAVIALACTFTAVVIVDIVATLAAIRKLNERLKRLTELAAEIHALSDEIGQKISDSTLAAKRKAEEGEEKLSESVQRLTERRQETEERIGQGRRAVADALDHGRLAVSERLSGLKERFSGALEEAPRSQRRLMNAFPRLTSSRYQDALNALREKHRGRKPGHKD